MIYLGVLFTWIGITAELRMKYEVPKGYHVFIEEDRETPYKMVWTEMKGTNYNNLDEPVVVLTKQKLEDKKQ
jgi:hypothetical protein